MASHFSRYAEVYICAPVRPIDRMIHVKIYLISDNPLFNIEEPISEVGLPTEKADEDTEKAS